MQWAPAGAGNAPCMVYVGEGLRKVDSKGFLQEFLGEAVAQEDGYPIYHRRDQSRTFTKQCRGLE